MAMHPNNRRRRPHGKFQKCSGCGLELDLQHFNRDKRNKKRNGGYRYDCVLCQYVSQHKSLGKKIKILEEERERKS